MRRNLGLPITHRRRGTGVGSALVLRLAMQLGTARADAPPETTTAPTAETSPPKPPPYVESGWCDETTVGLQTTNDNLAVGVSPKKDQLRGDSAYADDDGFTASGKLTLACGSRDRIEYRLVLKAQMLTASLNRDGPDASERNDFIVVKLAHRRHYDLSDGSKLSLEAGVGAMLTGNWGGLAVQGAVHELLGMGRLPSQLQHDYTQRRHVSPAVFTTATLKKPLFHQGELTVSGDVMVDIYSSLDAHGVTKAELSIGTTIGFENGPALSVNQALVFNHSHTRGDFAFLAIARGISLGTGLLIAVPFHIDATTLIPTIVGNWGGNVGDDSFLGVGLTIKHHSGSDSASK